MEGLRARYGDPLPAEAVERAEMELGVIDEHGLQRLLPDRLGLRQVRQGQRHRRRPGARLGRRLDRRLRAAASPTSTRSRYDLLFERFLNAERVSMPDIDIDFSVRGRERVMRYVTDKYGARVGRADHHLRPHVPARRHARRRARARPRLRRRRPAGEADPRPEHGPPAVVRGLPEAGRGPRRAVAYDATRTAKQIVDVARGLEGIVRNSSIHAAAVVIADTPLTDIVPLQLAEDRRGRRGRQRRSTAPSRSTR